MKDFYPIHDHSMSEEEVVQFLSEKGIILLSHDWQYLEGKAAVHNIPLKYIPENNTFEIHPKYYKKKQNGNTCND